jgi:hypothetical protein
MNNNDMNFEKILAGSDGKINRADLEKAVKSGNTAPLVNNLSDNDKQKLNNILNNKDELERLLTSPQARLILKMLGGKENG